MNLYKHYKNKFYKYTGIVKHSETQEEFVLYETLYDSPGGKTWIRPKDMFFEKITIDGKLAPRFKQVDLEIAQFTDIRAEQTYEIAALMQQIFTESDPTRFQSTLTAHTRFHLALARLDSHNVGFKLGYAIDDSTFYSWLGGVVPDYRGFGIARRLMAVQHEWCLQNGFNKVRTTAQNRFKAMLLLNLQHGFDILGVETQPNSEAKIILEKNLSKI
ncbi:MAG: GNAT family N-acetyltransferase [Bdellovibrionales bacterium]|nr:GNAT family N-acetyltransferase [Bdellovibrionales bacterium]